MMLEDFYEYQEPLNSQAYQFVYIREDRVDEILRSQNKIPKKLEEQF